MHAPVGEDGLQETCIQDQVGFFETWVRGELQAFVKRRCIQISFYAMTKTKECRFTVDIS